MNRLLVLCAVAGIVLGIVATFVTDGKSTQNTPKLGNAGITIYSDMRYTFLVDSESRTVYILKSEQVSNGKWHHYWELMPFRTPGWTLFDPLRYRPLTEDEVLRILEGPALPNNAYSDSATD